MLFRLSPPRRKGLWALACVFGLFSPSYAAGLNDTGITDCWNDSAVDNTTGVQADSGSHPRQDCRYGRDSQAAAGKLTKVGGGAKGFDFTKIANNGSELPATALLGTNLTDWACTRDNVTGLIWEVKTTSGLRSQSHIYSWYSSNAATNAGDVGTVSGGTCFAVGRCDTEKFVADVNAVGLCGAIDWRMPGVDDLVSITDIGRISPAIDPSYFSNTPVSGFWSGQASTYDAFNLSNAMLVNFDYGYTDFSVKSDAVHVRLVRAGQ
jgi:hypothetical protein